MPQNVIAIASKGYLAVDLFFILSGFVLWMTWGQRLASERWRAVPHFLRKRIARVWPLHAVILTATVALALVMMASGRISADQEHWRELPLHFLLLQNWGFTSQLSWNHPSWSISTELAAYFTFALLVPFSAITTPVSKNLSVKARIVCVVVVSTSLIIMLDQFFAFHRGQILDADIPHLGLARCLAQFMCGAAMCMIWQSVDGAVLRLSTATVFLVSVSMWVAGVTRETLAIPIAFAALVPFIASTSAARFNPLSSRVAIFLGEISYSTYLTHFLLWSVFKLVFVRNSADVSLLLGTFYLVLTLTVSILLYRLVERPARRWLG